MALVPGPTLADRIADGSAASQVEGRRTLGRAPINRIIPEYGSYFYDILNYGAGTQELLGNYVDSTEDQHLHLMFNWRDIVDSD